MDKKYTWTEINEMNVDSLRRLVVDLGAENPEFVGMSKKQKPFLINALWNYFMSTGQASFDDAAEDVSDDMFSDVDGIDPDDSDWSDTSGGDEEDEWEELPKNGFEEVMSNPRDKSKVIDGDIQHLHFQGMISRGVKATNVTVTITSGSMTNDYPVVGKSIYEVEKALGQILNVNPYARIVLVNGEEVTSEYIIKEGDIVEFVNEAYDKG